MKKLVYFKEQSIPVIADVEICVVGAGSGGIGAAVIAGCKNRDVLLVERYGSPGGMAFWGEVTPFMTNHVANKPLDGPVYQQWIKAMNKYTSQQ